VRDLARLVAGTLAWASTTWLADGSCRTAGTSCQPSAAFDVPAEPAGVVDGPDGVAPGGPEGPAVEPPVGVGVARRCRVRRRRGVGGAAGVAAAGGSSHGGPSILRIVAVILALRRVTGCRRRQLDANFLRHTIHDAADDLSNVLNGVLDRNITA
jgi:hypothetical protein